ncbi:integrase [Mycobacterium avium subsp. hominissuis 3388]|uniref:tyrosine-type recombinase/integrase n=1 Tax=Mycobacterium avium TaxID=1764 RepID=UPI00049F95C6|nr:tyrosine-type recombinase/integrase [Mycobacterium avium]KDP02919.1 integrase [Mycobacterium avium subsp. hominissuis 3388]
MTAVLKLVQDGGFNEMPPLDAWEIHMRGAGRSERTIRDGRLRIEHMERFTGKTVATMTPLDVSQFLARPTLNAWSKASYFGSIASFYRWYGVNGGVDITARLPRPKMPKSTPRPISDAQLRELLATNMRPKTRVMIMLAALAGLRVHEIAQVRGEDVDIEARTLRVTGKGNRTETLPLHPLLVEVARVMPRRGWWFMGNSKRPGQPIARRSVSEIIQMAMERAGIPGGTAHRLRHWYGTKLVADGADLRTVQGLMRHANLNTTAVYVQVVDGKRGEAIDRLTLPLSEASEPVHAEAASALERCKRSITRVLGRLEPGAQMSRTKLSQALRSDVRPHIDAAVDALSADGVLVAATTGRGRVYSLSSLPQ